MIDTSGMITVAEAAKRLNLSTEQVRRRLRDGKLRGQRIGNQWFVDPEVLFVNAEEIKPLIPVELIKRIKRNRESGFKRSGITFDAVALVNEVRDTDL